MNKKIRNKIIGMGLISILGTILFFLNKIILQSNFCFYEPCDHGRLVMIVGSFIFIIILLIVNFAPEPKLNEETY